MKKNTRNTIILMVVLAAANPSNMQAQQVEAADPAAGVPPKAAEPSPYLPYPYYNLPQTTMIIRENDSATLSQLLIQVAEKTGVLAKNVGGNIGEYVKEKQLQKKQVVLVQNFYQALDNEASAYKMGPDEYNQLRRGVERLYIEDGTSGKHQLDPIYFRQMPVIVKKVLADIRLPKIKDGPATIYYTNGLVYQQWNFKEGQPHGSVVTYYEDSGEIQFIDIYENGKRLLRRKYDAEGKLTFEQKYQYHIPPAEVASPTADNPVPSETG